MFNMHANPAVSEHQNCSNPMLKLAIDVEVGPLDCIWSSLYTKPNFVFVPLQMKILKYPGEFSIYERTERYEQKRNVYIAEMCVRSRSLRSLSAT